MQWYIAVAALITLAVSIFAIQNSQQVTLRFLAWDLPSFPLVLLILFSAATGVLITLLFSVAKQLRLTMQIREMQARIKKLEKQISTQPPDKAPAQDLANACRQNEQ
ncbi:MAG: LapA family protein [Bacillota bacterium]